MFVMLQQLIILFLFIGMGFSLGKYKKISLEKCKILSLLLVYLFLPGKILLSFSRNFTPKYLSENAFAIFLSLCLLLLMAGIAAPLSKFFSRDVQTRNVYRYSLVISNYAYMGYVLMEAAAGTSGLVDMILFCFPFSIYTNTFGYAMLTGTGNFAKRLVNPMTVAIVLGIVFGLSGIHLPKVFQTTLETTSNCAGPISMLFIGIVISTFSFQELLPNRNVVIFSVLRLAVMPLAVFLICKGMEIFILLPKAVFPSAVLMAGMPCGLNVVVMPELVGGDCKTGAKLVLFTHVLCSVTIPVWSLILL